jgi:hypothetical protein
VAADVEAASGRLPQRGLRRSTGSGPCLVRLGRVERRSGKVPHSKKETGPSLASSAPENPVFCNLYN